MKNNRKIQALITGGAGFIGSHLAEELIKKNYSVTILDNLSKGKIFNIRNIKKKLKFIKCNINKIPITIKNKKFDFIFHLAALTSVKESESNPKKYFLNNYQFSKIFFNSLDLSKTDRVIYAASSSCYGNTKNIVITEKYKINPISPYAKSKNETEKFLKKFLKEKKVNFISLRLFNVYGPKSSNDLYSGVISKFIKSFLNQKKIKIYSDGSQTRSFIYISDVIKAFTAVLKKNIINETFNVGSKKSVSINSLASLFKNKKIYAPGPKGDIKYSRSGISKIYSYTKWKPKVNLRKGLRLTIKFKKKYD